LDLLTVTPTLAFAGSHNANVSRKDSAIISTSLQDNRALLPAIDRYYSASVPSVAPENRHLLLRDLSPPDENEALHDEFFRNLPLLS